MSNVAISTHVQNGIWVITLSGELTSQDGDAMSAAYPWLNPAVSTQLILFDMSGLSYINSAGIALLIRFVRESRRREYTSYACGVSAHYQKIFRIVGLTSYLELFPDAYSAFETLSARQAGGVAEE